MNVYSDGQICLSIINEGEDWSSSITIRQILNGIQELLTTPNPKSAANTTAFNDFVRNNKLYKEKTLKQAKKFTPKS